jgi:hypothetical protein
MYTSLSRLIAAPSKIPAEFHVEPHPLQRDIRRSISATNSASPSIRMPILSQ